MNNKEFNAIALMLEEIMLLLKANEDKNNPEQKPMPSFDMSAVHAEIKKTLASIHTGIRVTNDSQKIIINMLKKCETDRKVEEKSIGKSRIRFYFIVFLIAISLSFGISCCLQQKTISKLERIVENRYLSK
ncbi:hypothetical protein M2480_002921 [Parabacteroides sp. PFB2-12]|uniref:hypothetical protein n=1 Tax=unclassified Parabacteroides TaxID=2649774 RepID=UPI002476BB8C|nr:MULTISPECIES: hypothetical protein [unclassified Parabacteroides]MDH6343756.1 hypothetical protein [Parabacteroides sp. PM6-13]MDH6391918.1 hypothetical protein [Parabacteroides sp. PFB2-12]